MTVTNTFLLQARVHLRAREVYTLTGPTQSRLAIIPAPSLGAGSRLVYLMNWHA